MTIDETVIEIFSDGMPHYAYGVHKNLKERGSSYTYAGVVWSVLRLYRAGSLRKIPDHEALRRGLRLEANPSGRSHQPAWQRVWYEIC